MKIINLKGKGLNFWSEVLINPKYVYIGRYVAFTPFKESKWHNPFSVEKFGREKAIELYKVYILKSDLLKQLPELKGKILCCWCKPEACHGDILIKLMQKSRRTLKNGNK